MRVGERDREEGEEEARGWDGILKDEEGDEFQTVKSATLLVD